MPTPRPYQIEGRDFLAGRRHALLADQMRVGKTPQAILAAHKAGAQSLLVVCPAIAVPQWKREIERWWADGPLPRHAVLSYDKARAMWQDGTSMVSDVFIPDEAHFAGNPAAGRTGMVYGKSGFAWNAGATWALSGTPAPKSAASLWPMLKAFGIVKMSYEDFLKYFCVLKPMSLVPTGTRAEHIPELRALLAQCMLRRTRKDVRPDMPATSFSFLTVEPKHKPDYKIPAGLTDEQLLPWLEANQAADKEDRVAVAQAKVEPLADEIAFNIDAALYRQTVVFGWHIEPLESLVTELNKRGLRAASITGATGIRQREQIQADFRAGRLHVVVANIIAAGTAIDLSSASHGYMLEMDWVPGNNTQAVDRLVSMDKDEPVTIDVVTWKGSVDEWVQRTVLTRTQQIAKLY